MGTKNNPGRFDCYANAEPDEPMFILLGRDRLGASLVALWAEAREMLDPRDPKVADARDCARDMHQWRTREPNKLSESVLGLLPFEQLARELRKRGATVTPAPHGGDFMTPNSD